MEFMTYVWIAAIILFAVVEVATIGIVSIWFMIGSIASFVVSLFWPQAILPQIIVCLVISCILLAFTRPIIKKKLLFKRVPTNADMNIGKIATVLKPITPTSHGRVQLNDLTWLATSQEELNTGDLCVVTAINGATLTVQKQNEEIKETV